MTQRVEFAAAEFSDEAEVRIAMSDAFSVCGECRRCVDRCSVFPTLFEMLDRLEGDAGAMTPAQQDQVSEGCVQCGLCTSSCPYGPGRHEDELDVARLMLRATAMRRANGHGRRSDRIAARTLGRPFWLGRLSTRVPGLANRLVAAPANTVVRRLVGRVAGVDARRLVAPFASERFTHWFERRVRIRLASSQRRVAIVPTCLVEFQHTSVGKDLVRVFERNGVECSMAGVGCCGAPLLQSGDAAGFARLAERNVAALAGSIRAGNDVVVPQPGCMAAVRRDYVDAVGDEHREEARLVADHVASPAEYLMRIHRSDDAVLDTDFRWAPRRVALHAACDLRSMGIGFESRDLLRLTGARVEMVQQCSGVENLWGLRTGNEAGDAMAERFGARVSSNTAEVLAGDCLLSNRVSTEFTDRAVSHPIELLARAYGIPVDG
ncbi:MAG: heterodisulfide reductase-related iron-sulfur binding cluster [Ilumatobacter sp.]